MTVSSNRDLSLYEIAFNAHPSLLPLQVSPATLKAVVNSTIDALIEQQIQAAIWVKLPPAEAWQADIKRYGNSGIAGPVYVLHYQKDEASEELAADIPLEGIGTVAEDTASETLPYRAQQSITDMSSTLIPIPLSSESQLRREYFMLVVSEQFCSLILAHRPRSMQSSRTEANRADSHLNAQSIGQILESGNRYGSAIQTTSLDGESLERKHPLLALYSVHGPVLSQTLQELRKVVSEIPSDVAGSPIDWERLQEICLSYHPDLLFLSNLFSKQVLRQEDIWHRASLYRRQAETTEALQLQNEELLNAIRLKDEFLSNVGQELRTPLTNMKTALTLLNSPQLKPAQRQRYMKLLSTECDRQSSLIASLQDLVQLAHAGDNTPMQALHLTDILPGVVSTYQPLAQEKGVMLAYTVPEELPPVSCLSTWLKQIAINLIHNGIKFTPTGGQVWVKAKQMGEYVQIEFRDTGIGISATEIPKIFDRFYRVRQAEDYGGAGLGLTIVQQILLRCGGSISVKSKLGEGSTFNVLLPIYKTAGE